MKIKNNSNIILVGFMGSGKTTIGKALAAHYKRDFRDTDKMIVEASGKSITDLFAVSEDYFRSWERDICKSLKRKNNLIISTGGGIVLHENNRDIISQIGYTIYLKASVDCIYERTNHCSHRPLLNVPNKKEVIRKKLEERDELYCKTSNLIIRVDNLTIEEIIDTIKDAYEHQNT